MEIPRDFRPADPPVRKRPGEAATRAGSQAPTTPGTTGADRADFGDAATIGRYVNVLKTMDPVSLHKVEDLRARIADGSYTADPEELADLLLDGRPAPGGYTSRPKPG
jgi:anti-sigma28 factor (negative regulator of flagellin synthesis)